MDRLKRDIRVGENFYILFFYNILFIFFMQNVFSLILQLEKYNRIIFEIVFIQGKVKL